MTNLRNSFAAAQVSLAQSIFSVAAAMTTNGASVNGSSNGNQALTPGKRLRTLLDRKEILVAPGVYDGFSARIALEVGFDCLYMVN